jgi:two-component system, response regulator, stage 0 sporulation protein F
MSTHPRVLIVDDEASLRRQLMVGLVQHGYEVDECEEGLAALTKIKAAESKQSPFCCVILDVRLPDIDGLKILSVIKAAYADLPVVVITGYGNEDTVNTVQSHGGSVYLDKPFEMGTLVSVLERIGPRPRGSWARILRSERMYCRARWCLFAPPRRRIRATFIRDSALGMGYATATPCSANGIW